jgi:Cd2+/Zn2+-exporting ATPase
MSRRESSHLPDYPLESHEGIFRVSNRPGGSAVDVEFDPSVLSDLQVRNLLREHISQVEQTLRRRTYRLEGHACEACAQKLESKVARIPGVRRATATYLGKVLSVTFDAAIEPEHRVEADLKRTGADIHPLSTFTVLTGSLIARIRSGDYNQEISSALGLVFLIAAAVAERVSSQTAWSHWLYIGAYGFAGQQGVRSALASLRQKVLDVDVLMVLAALGAAWIGAPFEGALLLFLFSFSNVLQSHAMERTRRAIESLLSLHPKQAQVRRGTEIIALPVEQVHPGDIVVVKPGEQIPVDGVLTEGRTNIDESSLTGESMPVSKSVGSSLFAGTINQSGGIEMRAARVSEDSTLARMVRLVAEAQSEKSKTQRFLEKAEQYYAMGVIALTALVFVVPVVFAAADFASAFYRAMTVMVVASPCALIISTPATVLSAIGGAARKGILIKGGSHLERAAAVDIVALDKTGTLTVGKPSLTHIVTESGTHLPDERMPQDVANLLRIGSAIESRSEHPLARAVMRCAREQGIDPPLITDFQSLTGKGAEASVGDSRYLVGSARWFTELNASTPPALEEAARRLQLEGRTCIWIGRRTGDAVSVMGMFAMADTIRPEAADLVRDLRHLGIRRVIMLTGDHEWVACSIAKEAGIDEVRAQLLPADKLEIIRELRREGTVMMVGDGVNDAPALAISDVGVAMGAAGTDVAMETADIVLMGDRIGNIPLLLSHTRRAKRVLVQNLTFAAAVIVVLVSAALGFSLPLPVGVVGHEGSTVLVCLNGLRLLMIAKTSA